MTRRQFRREFKLEAVRLVKERGVSVAQACRDLEVGESLLRRWLKDYTSDPGQAFPGQGQLRPEQQEIERPSIAASSPSQNRNRPTAPDSFPGLVNWERGPARGRHHSVNG